MGALFRHIADDALIPIEAYQSMMFHCCERTDVPLYDYFGKIVDPEFAKSPEMAKDEDVDELCADCILSGNVRKHNLDLIERTANRLAENPEKAIEAFHLFPQIPLFLQDQDWPTCCDDWCEYIGSPEDYDASVAIPDQSIFWDNGVKKWQLPHSLEPESLLEVNVFRCFSCAKTYFTWQST